MAWETSANLTTLQRWQRQFSVKHYFTGMSTTSYLLNIKYVQNVVWKKNLILVTLFESCQKILIKYSDTADKNVKWFLLKIRRNRSATAFWWLWFVFYDFRNGSQRTASSESVSRRTVTTLMPQWYTGTTRLAVNGLWPSTRGGKQKWAPVHESNPNTSPPTSYPGSAFMTTKSASRSQTGAKIGGKLSPKRHRPSQSKQEHHQDEHKSSTGPSTDLDRCMHELHQEWKDKVLHHQSDHSRNLSRHWQIQKGCHWL